MKLAEGTTLITGGELIDGTGSPPVRDAALVIENAATPQPAAAAACSTSTSG